MAQIISAFEVSNKYGGGVITRKLLHYFGDSYKLLYRNNAESRIRRFFRIFMIWLRTPSLHPIFCAFGPSPSTENVILNFSQTFNLVLRFPDINFDVVSHDIIVQKRLFMNFWVRQSEAKIFKSARRIYVLSEKDGRLVRRFYNIPHYKIINLFPNLYPEIKAFNSVIIKQSHFRVMFLGSISRDENYRGLEWFYKNVFPSCCNDIEVVCVGETNDLLSANFPEFKFIGFVKSLTEVLLQCDFTIAPILDGAGIKIKVVDSLVSKVPVLGTPKAYEGIGRPNILFCSYNPTTWIRIIKSNRVEFSYRPPV